MRIYFLLLSVLILSLPQTVVAQEIVTLPEGQTALNISATERVEVEQDLLVGSLRVQFEAKKAADVQKHINQLMTKALGLVKEYPEVKVETGHYYVHPDYRYIKIDSHGNEKQKLDKWRGSQTITLKSKKADDVLKLVGVFQDIGFVMNNLNYQLSPDKHDKVREALMETTIKALKARAERVGKALGKDQVDLVEINIDSHHNNPRPMYARAQKMEMMDMSVSAMPAPVAQAGETTVSMTISARAIIKP